jgi:Tol biopolymer transport system component
MKYRCTVDKGFFSRTGGKTGVLCLLILALCEGAPEGQAYGSMRGKGGQAGDISRVPSPRNTLNLQDIPFKIVYETYRRTEGRYNWELFMMNADGSDKVNLTNTPGLDEMYAHVSPDATKISFVVDEGTGRDKIRNVYYKIRSVYYMNIDGADRVKVARNAREPCWGPDSKKIAYLKGEFERYSTREYATSELLIYDIETGEHKLHPNTELEHIYAICWSPDAKWLLCAVQGNTVYSDTILAFEADGTKVFDLAKWGVKGCRPDISLDGRLLAWGETDWELRLGRIDLSGPEPRVDDLKYILGCVRAAKVYHVDLSPDGKYLAFSYGPEEGGQQVGGKAKGWNICIADMNGVWVKITTDGNHNKEPDWVPIPPANRATVEEKTKKSPLEKILYHPLIDKKN